LAVFITNISEFDFSMSDKVLGTHNLGRMLAAAQDDISARPVKGLGSPRRIA
jgi:hypothetical protein